MFLILSIMFCGVALGAALRNRRWPARTAGRLIQPVICLLLLCMGISVGGNREVIGNFPSLGLDALVITVGALLGSLLGAKAVYARFFKQKGTGTEAPCVIPYSPECKKTAAPGPKRRFPAAETTAAPVSAPVESRPENSSGATGTGPEKPKKSNDSLKILLSFLLGAALGIAAGQLHNAVPSESTAGQLLSFLTTAADRGSVRVLYLLMFLVGISVGSEGGILRQLRSSGLKILLVPAATILGTWAGVALLSPLVGDRTLTQCLMVGSGFGYYSLSGILISQSSGVALGTTSLIANILRELAALTLAPVLVRLFGPLAPICAGGATTMDTTLPVIAQFSGKNFIFVAIVHGIVVDFSVPVSVTLFSLL